jgi:hypothetical protein
MSKDEAREAEKIRGKHVGFTKKLREQAEAELGKYADGGPAFVVTRPEWDGMTKTLDNATDEELGQITSVVLHIAPG